MILPIIAYGNKVLTKKTIEVKKNDSGLNDLISNMFETMYNAQGVGLAAPQIGQSLRLFIVDTSPFKNEEKSANGFKKVFINPQIIEEAGDEELFNEGCLSIPEIREDVSRKSHITITYFDEKFNKIRESFSGIKARVIQHEYDHVEGILFIEKLKPIRKRFLQKKLNNIAVGNINVMYPMKFLNKKKW